MHAKNAIACTRKGYAVVVWGLRPDNTRSMVRSCKLFLNHRD
jgi:hypothetical protein